MRAWPVARSIFVREANERTTSWISQKRTLADVTLRAASSMLCERSKRADYKLDSCGRRGEGVCGLSGRPQIKIFCQNFVVAVIPEPHAARSLRFLQARTVHGHHPSRYGDFYSNFCLPSFYKPGGTGIACQGLTGDARPRGAGAARAKR